MFYWLPSRAPAGGAPGAGPPDGGCGPDLLAQISRDFPNISLDHGILERADKVAVVPVEMSWNDVGTWRALQDIFPQDGQGNVILGRALDRDSKGCIIYAQNRLVATIGLENVIVVDTPDATLVCHRERVQEVKDLVAELNRREMVESVQHLTVERPWGSYTVMEEGPGYKVKQIEVAPGSRLSLQMHQHRAEHWVVVQGTAKVTIGSDIKLVTSNQSVYIPLKTAHRLENPETSRSASSKSRPALISARTTSSVWTTITPGRKKSFEFRVLRQTIFLVAQAFQPVRVKAKAGSLQITFLNDFSPLQALSKMPFSFPSFSNWKE